MEQPPSYQDATKRVDWLELAAPYVSFADYPRLCLVCKRFYKQFAPRLWHDPLTAALKLGLVQEYDYEWYFRFIMKHLKNTRSETRDLVATLDFRGFPLHVPRMPVEFDNIDINQTMRMLPAVLPRLRYVLLDGHPDMDASQLVTSRNGGLETQFYGPLVLGISGCQVQHAPWFLESGYLANLVYLDVSHVQFSLEHVIFQGKLSPRALPHLRVLKARGPKLDDMSTITLLQAFKRQLWGLDLSGSKITDRAILTMPETSFPALSFRTGVVHFDVEGMLFFESESGDGTYGRYAFIQESPWSDTFRHPQRHLADAPTYTESAAHEMPRQPRGRRLDGRGKIRVDSADEIKSTLAGTSVNNSLLADNVYELDICRDHDGITHLYLNDTQISADTLGRLIRESAGQLERLECDITKIILPPVNGANPPLPLWLTRNPRLYGAIGMAHFFRPVWSSDLQVLRIHHSFVTQLVSLVDTNLPVKTNLWLAETFLHPRVELAYPEAFVPDMNPRLRSLTLTGIPRYSTGPLIDKLIAFLNLASSQERAIQDAESSRLGPSTLLGLRHIHLEFGPALSSSPPRDDIIEVDLDAEDFGLEPEDFSFFAESGGWVGVSSPTSPAATHEPPPASGISEASAKGVVVNSTWIEFEPLQTRQPQHCREPAAESGRRLQTYPYSETEREYVPFIGTWNGGKRFMHPVWIGSGCVSGQGQALDEYMRNLANPLLRTRIEPASPSHVAAGVPPGKFVFADAWAAILIPPEMRMPRQTRVDGMRDVLSAIRAHRVQTRTVYEEAKAAATRRGEAMVRLGAPHMHYTGRVEISFEATESEGD
ncbi:hypothetical protein B0H66DRAFT_563634 [Apodospora peruviana]|uniref:Uncharacterized protein n=1 Tax=Apodospora peruviana TaxID=516989 RepID=A0AAE0HXQ0_9PEZI|nr:hypothetical protein B0H66DRAFT_563634 [Apodospora peruviana]